MKILKCATIAFALFGGIVKTTYAENVELHFNQWFPKSHWSQTKGLYPWFEEIAKVTEGRVNQSYDAVASGLVDIAWGAHGYTPDKFPLAEMVEHPFGTNDAGASSAAYWDIWKQYFEPAGMHSNVVTLGMHTTSGGNIHLRSGPVASVDELLSKHLRVPTHALGRVLDNQGAQTTNAPIGTLRSLLDSNSVDGTAITDELSLSFRVTELIDSVTRIPGGLYSNSGFIVVNKDKWEQISPEDQKAILAISGKSISRKMGALWHEEDLKARVRLQEIYGNKYKTASPEFISDLNWIFLGEVEEWIHKANQLGVDGVTALAAYKALREKYE